MTRVYVAHVEITPGIASKIRSKHSITPDEVREAISVGMVSGRWHVHTEYGRRFLIIGRTYEGRVLKVILQAVDEGEGQWRLRTAIAARAEERTSWTT